MAENKVIRCPECMRRDIDSELFYDKKDDEYYCRLCCYSADEETAFGDLKKFKTEKYKSYKYSK
ncbi:hypothetical protein [Ructibacterium gallinarum]|uniref:Uncharacterized protein n=1 Tax=Ructibacterium gallinarum TaxID=2779355 RepID=A0A9D5RC55_9FIRM|nr:hypothetical protein [Ructibacterium gallinarum]MBE5040678.1 hypothetical protein [Ructibacterium gallinarum]